MPRPHCRFPSCEGRRPGHLPPPVRSAPSSRRAVSAASAAGRPGEAHDQPGHARRPGVIGTAAATPPARERGRPAPRSPHPCRRAAARPCAARPARGSARSRARGACHRRQQRGPPARILGAHAADMRGEQALAHELGQDRLVERVDAAVHQRAEPHESRHQRRRHDGEAQTQRRRQRLAEGAAVDHPAGAIQRGERRQRMAAPAELGIAVVFQDPGVRARAAQSSSASRRPIGSAPPSGVACDGRDQREAGVGRALRCRRRRPGLRRR